jgi:DNA-binding CsgD family transcriptional regulator
VTRDQKIAEARRLRAQGLKYREIAERLGVGTSTVYAWLNPARVRPYRSGRGIDPQRARAYDREYYRSHKGTCYRCGGERGRGPRTGPCRACVADDVDRRARQIEQWWAEGLTIGEISSRLKWPSGRFGAEMVRLRAKGYDLPYRRAVYPSGKPKFPDQVAA